MPSCNTYHLTWVSVTLAVGYLFKAAPEKLLILDEGYLLTTTVPDLQRGIAPLGPPVPVQLLLLGMLLLATPFHYRGLECKSRKSRNTWSNRQIWPWNVE